MADEVLAGRSVITPGHGRSIELEKAVLDAGSTRLVLTSELVQRLGLPLVGEISIV